MKYFEITYFDHNDSIVKRTFEIQETETEALLCFNNHIKEVRKVRHVFMAVRFIGIK